MKNHSKSESNSLKRCFGLRESVTITVGTVIGVGLFTVGANMVGVMGNSVIFATLAALAVSIYPALLYAEMSSMLPFAGGTYQYATYGINRLFGMLAGWSFIISMVSVASGEALAFSFYFKKLFEALGFTLCLDDRIIACAIVLGFIALGVKGVEITGKLQNGFMFFFWGVAVVWFFSMIPSFNLSNINLVHGSGIINLKEFLPSVAMIWWCFAGFETCCAMGEEIKYPHINLPRALFLAPFIVFTVNGLFQWVLLAAVPPDSMKLLAESAAPYAEGMKIAGIAGFPLIMLCAGIAFGGDFSTLNASITAPARYLFTMSRDGVIPRVFSYVHSKYNTPWISVIFLGLLMIVLIGTNSIKYIASLSLSATLFYYILGIVSALRLRKRYPNANRCYKAPLINIGATLSIVIYIIMIAQLELSAVLAGIVWCLSGAAIYIYYQRKNNLETKNIELPEIGFDFPQESEKIKMDREYRNWKIIVAICTLFVTALYIVPCFAD
ncbi:APC family permease [Lachnospiraceae bacterium NSJ-143]|nr:APC family permease [Lachnospiraceae bacterium NSJ-143]